MIFPVECINYYSTINKNDMTVTYFNNHLDFYKKPLIYYARLV